MLHEHLYKGMLVYLNDTLIYMETMAEHVKLVKSGTQRRAAKLSKYVFHQSKIDYLGYRISYEGIEMDPKKVKVVLEWFCPIPKSNCKLFGICKLLLPIDPVIRPDCPPHHQSAKDEGEGKPKSIQPLKWTIRVPGSFQKI